MIHPDRMVRHDLEPRRKLGNNLGAEMFGMAGDHGVEVRARRDQVGSGAGGVCLIHNHVVIARGAGKRGIRQATGDPKARFLAHFLRTHSSQKS